MVKNKGLIAEAYDWDEEEVSSDDNEMVEVKVLMALAEDNEAVSKEGAKNGEWVKISMRKVHTLLEMEDNDDRKNYLDYSGVMYHVFVVHVVEQPLLSKAEGFIMPNHDSGRILLAESQRNTIDPPVVVTDSSETDYDSVDESSSISTFKAKALKGVIINKPTSAPAKGNKSTSASKVNSAPAGKLKNVKIKDDLSLAIVIKELNKLKLQISKTQSSCSRSEALQAKNVDALKLKKTGSSKANRSKTLSRGWVSRQN
ncbi:hypothetical protein Tco_0929394 [Tanacetum coccineum]